MKIGDLLLSPPVLFGLLFAVTFALSYLLSGLSSRPQEKGAGQKKPYACGEDMPVQRAQFDYTQFYHFALFFTIMHVVVLILTTVPAGALMAYGLAAVYLLGAVSGIIVLFKR